MLAKLKLTKKKDLQEAAVIWAYHQYYDYKAVKYFDHFMNLALLYGLYKTTSYILYSVKLILSKGFRGIFQSKKRNFYKYALP